MVHWWCCQSWSSGGLPHRAYEGSWGQTLLLLLVLVLLLLLLLQLGSLVRLPQQCRGPPTCAAATGLHQVWVRSSESSFSVGWCVESLLRYFPWLRADMGDAFTRHTHAWGDYN